MSAMARDLRAHGPLAPLACPPAVGEHAVLVTVPEMRARVAELERLVCELRARLALLYEPGETTDGGW